MFFHHNNVMFYRCFDAEETGEDHIKYKIEVSPGLSDARLLVSDIY